MTKETEPEIFDRDAWGNALYVTDEVRSLKLDGYTYLFKTSQAEKMLKNLTSQKWHQVLSILKLQYGHEVISMLFQENGYETPMDMLNDLGAIIVNEGEAA
ncbi:hypothetical protein [Furfurilactobacillus milii]|uniref:Uncharacterized protein n=1 Tax=Furfurilactobacillus milii TaxID=2888272 RepID=A0ABT6DCK7_9LACO|nr:hypothetical protein [Furfurilactobacillus milii]QLE66959.1 hypothetical protein LROSL2_1609 [Furfurilactobacillus rossiae]MCF6161968.1 hypothetical protein [Furfurilactobacillus milii]MCF6164348.1 hypothetical protein [Furfurilactobacillus milii]MDF9914836.1 hypothetical protein [Furfurilactobacillus milii]QLE69389.1 hypothetical protein LROSL3_1610 [Furfurilactobacillus rossiae]